MRTMLVMMVKRAAGGLCGFAIVISMGIAADYGLSLAHADPTVAAAPQATTAAQANAAARQPSIAASLANTEPSAVGPDPGAGKVRLPGHVLSALSRALPVTADRVTASNAPITVTLTLRHDDQKGFERYLERVYEPHSLTRRRFLTQAQIGEKYGPSRTSYDAVLGYLTSAGLMLVEGSKNRLTLTVQGSREAIEAAFSTQILDYRIGDSSFFANVSDPALPQRLAQKVVGISGLNDLAHPQHTFEALRKNLIIATCILLLAGPAGVLGALQNSETLNASETAIARYFFVQCVNGNFAAAGYGPQYTPIPLYLYNGQFSNGASSSGSVRAKAVQGHASASSGSPTIIDGKGQTIGLLEFDDFNVSDVSDFLSLAGAPSTVINNVSKVPVNGGISSPGSSEDEVLLDIDDVLIAAPGVKVKVYEAPFTGQTTSYTALFNAMIDDGVTIISNSWASCEDQTSAADVQAIDQVLQTAAASGIGVFSGAGDSGSTCLDGSAGTVAVPADSPHATAVGGSSLRLGPGFTYQSETWWNGSNSTPVTGQGGFGVSRFFPRPSYQNSLNSAANRSVPDVVANADPANGIMICQADNGGCPSGYLYGGTSSSTPQWAAYEALINQAVGHNLGLLNSSIYPLASSNAFHDAASMQSDFTHVGLGSPNIGALTLALGKQTVGAVSAGVSQVYPFAQAYSSPPPSATPTGVAADGSSPLYIVVRLMDATGTPVSGKTVTLTGGGRATITPTSGVSTVANGSVTFTVTDATIETLSFTATDTTDNIVLSQSPSVPFIAPPATGGSIDVAPAAVAADGQTPATVSVTLKNALNQPSSGKVVVVSDNGGHAVITGPTGGVTDANGQIQFSATDQVSETVTFTATDVTDGNLPVPGSGTVTYSGSTNTACGVGVVPVAGSGYQITPFISGLPAAASLYYGGANTSCDGANTPTFTSAATVLVTDNLTGGIYQLGLTGGAAGPATLLNTLTPLLRSPVYGKDGSLYATIGNEGGEIVQIDVMTGAIARVVASGLTCPTGLAVDPLSGDLFFDDGCTGGGTDDPSLYRVIDPADTDASNPTSVVVYATLPATPNGGMAFAPNGTLYAVSGYQVSGFSSSQPATVQQISRTNAASVTLTPVSGLTSDYSVAIGKTNPDGSAQSLIVEPSGTLTEVPIANPSTAVVLASGSPSNAVTGGAGVGTVGPDGCLYIAHYDTIYKLSGSNGACRYSPSNPAPFLSLSPSTVAPNPAQGSAVTLTATIHNVSPLAGVPVVFQIGGANAQVQSVNTNSNGNAVLTYTGLQTGTDTTVAYADSSNSTVTSNSVLVSWGAGKHVTFLSMNSSPQGSMVNQAVTVVGTLYDASANPNVAIAGQTVTFTLDGATCSGVTNSSGVASCMLTPAQPGIVTLSATFAGNEAYAADAQSIGFKVSGLPAMQVTVTTKSGGGAIDRSMLCLLSLLLLLRMAITRRPHRAGPSKSTIRSTGGIALLFMMVFCARAVRADEPSGGGSAWFDPFYVGLRAGDMPLHIDASKIDQGLASMGFDDVHASVEHSGAAESVFAGYEFARYAALELSYTFREATSAHLSGTIPAGQLTPLLKDTTELIRGYGNIIALSYSAHLEVAPRLSLEPRLGGFFWATKDSAVGLNDRVDTTHEGGGATVGITAAYRLWRGLELGLNVDHYRGFPNNVATLYGGSLEWRFAPGS